MLLYFMNKVQQTLPYGLFNLTNLHYLIIEGKWLFWQIHVSINISDYTSYTWQVIKNTEYWKPEVIMMQILGLKIWYRV
jgi:hypothetical protein